MKNEKNVKVSGKELFEDFVNGLTNEELMDLYENCYLDGMVEDKVNNLTYDIAGRMTDYIDEMDLTEIEKLAKWFRENNYDLD